MTCICKVRHPLLITLTLLLAACGGGGGGGGGTNEPTPPSSSSTISAYYSKAPVDGATCHLYSTNDQIVAGPVTSNSGSVVFNSVSYTGDVYTHCSGGNYIDEATAETVQLTSNQIMRSVTTSVSRNSSVSQVVTPLTELAHRYARSSGDLSSSSMAVQAANVADEFGLDGVDITQIQPTPLAAISGNSDADVYGVALAAISQMQEDTRSSQTAPTGSELFTLIDQMETTVDQTNYTQGLTNLTTNSNTQSTITDTTAIKNQAGITNTAPTANAGNDQPVTSGNTVNLTGIGTDSEGGNLTYQWQEMDTTALSLGMTNSAGLSFTAPTVLSQTTYTLQLTVTDNGGLTDSDTVSIIINVFSSLAHLFRFEDQ